MEIARLFDQDVDIAKEWFSMASSGTSRENITKTLEGKYRTHSDKNAFTCQGCKKPVTLVLRTDSPHFRHQGDPCPSSENYGVYINGIRSHGENILIHRAGRAILRTYLEGQMKPHNVIVQAGYMYRQALKIVPDFILTFPDGSIWSIDYITGTREDEGYNSFIKKRTTIYRAAGFTPFYFIDSSWLAEIPDRPVVSLYLAENQMKIQSPVDLRWSEFVKEYFEVFGIPFVMHEMFGVQIGTSSPDQSNEVFSLAYVNPGEGRAFIQRFIPANRKFGYHIYRAAISLEKATSLSVDGNGFQWWDDDESKDMIQRLESLSNKYEEGQHQLAEQESFIQENIASMQEEEDSSMSELITEPFAKLAADPFDQAVDSLVSMIHMNMTVADANHIYQMIREKKSVISKSMIERIRAQARSVMGPLRNPNPISTQLRNVLIDLAMI